MGTAAKFTIGDSLAYSGRDFRDFYTFRIYQSKPTAAL